MSADADELLARARRAEQRDEPTRDEVMRELEQALDEVEAKFPGGKPVAGSGFDGLRYQALLLKIATCRRRLEDGDYAAPRVALGLVPSQSDEQWQAFVDSHPELAPSSDDEPSEEVQRDPLTFTDADLVKALRAACKRWHARWGRACGVPSSFVAAELVGCEWIPAERRWSPARPTHSEVIRVGQALARLEKQGHVLRSSKRWESTNRWQTAKRRSLRDA